jgi:hypothetical protein
LRLAKLIIDSAQLKSYKVLLKEGTPHFLKCFGPNEEVPYEAAVNRIHEDFRQTPLTSFTAIVQLLNEQFRDSEDEMLRVVLIRASIPVKKMKNMILPIAWLEFTD